MSKDDAIKTFLSQDEDQSILLEKMVFAYFADDCAIESYLNIENLELSELFTLLTVLYSKECFLMILDIMSRYRERFIFHNVSVLDEFNVNPQFISRLEKLIKHAESRR